MWEGYPPKDQPSQPNELLRRLDDHRADAKTRPAAHGSARQTGPKGARGRPMRQNRDSCRTGDVDANLGGDRVESCCRGRGINSKWLLQRSEGVTLEWVAEARPVHHVPSKDRHLKKSTFDTAMTHRQCELNCCQDQVDFLPDQVSCFW